MAILILIIRLHTSFCFKPSRWVWLAGLALLFSSGQDVPAQSTSTEYQVKAAFLYNFSQFIEWPAGVMPGTTSPLVIGILGQDPFGGYLDDLVRGERVNNHPLVIRRFHQVGEIRNCQILFISQSEATQLEQILAILKGRNILTVGDLENFAVRGGMIRFITQNNKIRFRINVEAARGANLTISSKLLRAAEVVGSSRD
jgi:hypothetical protein